MTGSCRSDFFMPGKLLRLLPDVVCDQLDSFRFVGILQRRHEFPVLRGGGPDQPGKPVLPAELLPEQRLKNPAEYLKRPIAAGLQQQKVKITVGKIGFLGEVPGSSIFSVRFSSCRSMTGVIRLTVSGMTARSITLRASR